MIMATVAAGSVNVLALVPWASRLFIALLMIPLIALFATTGDMDDLVIAGLGLALFIGLTGFARVANESAAQLILMARQREQRWIDASSECDALLREYSGAQALIARWGGAEFALAITGDLDSSQFGAAPRPPCRPANR